MSRRIVSLALVVCLGLLTAPVPFASAQSKTVRETRTLLQLLGMSIPTAKYVTPTSFKDVMQPLDEYTTDRGHRLSIVINHRAFQARGDDANAFDFDSVQVSLPNPPRELPLRLALRHMLDQFPTPATFVMRQGIVEIVPLPLGMGGTPLRQPVLALFEGQPLRDALEELSSQTGATINLDGREEEKGKNVVTAIFRGNVTLHEAATILANMAGLRVVVLENSLYVTSAANAEQLKKGYAPAPQARNPRTAIPTAEPIQFPRLQRRSK